jgi:hypothetical protein
MYAVVRRYSGPRGRELIDLLERRKGEIEGIIKGVKGLVSYTLIRTDDGGLSVTVCEDKAGVEASMRLTASWMGPEPEVSEGPVILSI